MLRYEWNHSNNNNHNNHSPPPPNLILSDIDLHHHHHHHNHHDYFSNANPSSTTSTLSNPHHRPIFDDPFSNPCTFTHDNTPPPHSHLQHHHQLPIFGNNNNNNTNNNNINININDNNNNSFNVPPQPCSSSFLTLESLSSVMQIPKTEQVGGDDHHHQFFSSRPIGLNLGRRTYFSADDDLVSRLYRRSRVAEPAIHSPKCQAEGCSADLSHAKHYHRRHKVCEFHSKASTVIAAGLTQRFCQQCSRFHLLSEFDNGKRSCRKRLADHNRRRRKSNNQRSTSTAPPSFSSDNPQTSPSQHILRSPSDSGLNSSSSVTIAISPPRVSFDSNFMQRSYD